MRLLASFGVLNHGGNVLQNERVVQRRPSEPRRQRATASATAVLPIDEVQHQSTQPGKL
jgi:hypothetical protein